MELSPDTLFLLFGLAGISCGHLIAWGMSH